MPFSHNECARSLKGQSHHPSSSGEMDLVFSFLVYIYSHWKFLLNLCLTPFQPVSSLYIIIPIFILFFSPIFSYLCTLAIMSFFILFALPSPFHRIVCGIVSYSVQLCHVSLKYLLNSNLHILSAQGCNLQPVPTPPSITIAPQILHSPPLIANCAWCFRKYH